MGKAYLPEDFELDGVPLCFLVPHAASGVAKVLVIPPLHVVNLKDMVTQ